MQTPDYVMILTEMVHDARIIRIGGAHLPQHVRKWMGDSIGHWDGDTLVVETTNFTDKTRFRRSTDNLRVIERFSRIDDNTLLYRFEDSNDSTRGYMWSVERDTPWLRARFKVRRDGYPTLNKWLGVLEQTTAGVFP